MSKSKFLIKKNNFIPHNPSFIHMHPYAQTNIQLLNQLRRDGYSNTDLTLVSNAYKLVMQLFTGSFRASGKTFIAHLVGTASILGHLHVDGKIITAGLLHATYAQGDFGGIGKQGISEAKRKQIWHFTNQEIEEYIARYTTLTWNEQTIAEIYKQLDEFDQSDRDVLLIRLANELEEYLDLGIVYCGDTKYQQYIHREGHLLVEMAEKLGYPTLATELASAIEENVLAEIPTELCNPTGRQYSSQIPPNSYQIRLLAWFYQTIGNRIEQRLNF